MKPKYRSTVFKSNIISICLGAGVSVVAQAAGVYWDANAGTTGPQAGNGIWDNGITANWNPTSAGTGTNNLVTFATTDDAFFTVAPNVVTIAPAGITANSLQLFTTTGATTINGGTLTLTSVGTTATGGTTGAGATAISLNSGMALVMNSNLVLGASATSTQTFAPQGGALAINGNITDGGAGVDLAFVYGNGSFSRYTQLNGAISVRSFSTTQGGSGNSSMYLSGDITTSGTANFANGQSSSVGDYYQLGGSNTFSGGLVFRGGILSVSSDANLGGASSAITFNQNGSPQGGALLINGTSLTSFGSHSVTFTFGTLVGIDVAAGSSFTVDKVLNQTTGGFSKNNAGNLTLNQANTYTGATILRGGTVTLDYSTNDNSKIATGAALTLGGTNLTFNGGTFAQTVNGLNLNAGANAITQTGGDATISVAGITRSAGATLDVSAGGVASTTTGTASTLLTNSAGAYAMIAGSDWAAKAASGNNIVGLSTVGGYTLTTATALSGNADVDSSVDTTLASGGSATTLRFNQNEARTITIGGGQVLSLSAGGILVSGAVNPGAGTSTITGGTLAATSAADAIQVIQNSSKGLIIGSIIADRAGQSGGTFASTPLTKSGTGTLTLTGNNTFTGQTFLNQGTLSIGSDANLAGGNGIITIVSSLTTSTAVTYSGTLPAGFGVGSRLLGQTVSSINPGASTLVLGANAGAALTNQTASWATASQLNLNGGTLQATSSLSLSEVGSSGAAGGTQTQNRAVVLGANGGTLETNGSGTTLTVAGVISSANVNQTGGLTKTGAGTLALNGNNQFTGGVTINGGTLQMGNTNALGAIGQVRSGVAFGASSSGTLSLNGFSPTITGLTGDSTATVQNNHASNASTLTVQTVGGSQTFDGLIKNGAAATLGLTKDGAGTLTLTNANTYTGATSINAGKVVVTNSISNSAVTVNYAGATLATDAAATIGSSLTVNSGAIMAAGDAGSAGTATVGGTGTFNNGSIFSWDINATGTTYDKLIATGLAGEATAGDAVFRIVAEDSTFGNTFWSSTRTWTDIFTTNGTTAVSGWASLFSVSVVNSSFAAITPTNGAFAISGNTLTWTAVPEPTTALAGLLLGAGLLRRRRAATAGRS